MGGARRFARFLGDAGEHELAAEYWNLALDGALTRLFQNPSGAIERADHRRVLLDLGLSLQKAGRPAEARNVYVELSTSYPATREAGRAEDALGGLR